MASKKKKLSHQVGGVFAYNKKALYLYDIIEKKEAGIALTGNEVKAVKQGKISIRESYAKFFNHELYLLNTHIAPYQPQQKNQKHATPTRRRKLLLHRSELNRLYGKSKEKGLTLVPLSMYQKHNHIKVEIGLGKGRKKYDKREKEKKKEDSKSIKNYLILH